MQSELVLLVSMAAYCIYYLKLDFWPLQINRLDISSVYSIGLLLNTISHIIAITSTDPFIIKNYLLRYIPEHLFIGMLVFNVGSVVIMETFRYYLKPGLFTRSEILSLLGPKWSTVLLVGFFFFFINNFTSVGSLGTLGTILGLVVFGAVFYLSTYAHFYNDHFKINSLLIFVIFLSFWALWFSYLRYEIILPWISYFFGEAIARKRFMAFTLQSKVIIVCLLIIAPPVFTYLGENRAEISGRSDKISLIVKGVQEEQDLDRGQTIMSRLSYINQLTHVVGLVKKNDFYEGETLYYLGFVFIPRFLWPEKPTIQQGQWFALETGLAYQLKGKVNNSINMTVPGEFYLNFGWSGVIIGCFLFGLFIVFVWNGIQGNNLPSWGLQFFLLFSSMAGLGADLQAVVTLLSYFLIYKVYVLLTGSDKPLVQAVQKTK